MRNISLKILALLLFLISPQSAQSQVAGFTADHTTGCMPLIVHFHNTSTGATNYSWSFGNSGTSLLTDPSTSYISAGTYTVTLIAYNGALSDTYSTVITVYPLPTAGFTAGDTTLCPRIATTFTSISSPGMPGGITYSWNFGDGSTSTLSTPSHSYPLTDIYNITLFVTNAGGCTSSLSKDGYIHVFPQLNAGFNTATPYICEAPATVHFNNTTTGVTPIFYQWSFGDLGISPLPAPNHTYTAPGSYDVTLRATDANGCSDTEKVTGYINIGNLTASFPAINHGCVGDAVAFSNTSNTHISSDWDFGDGGTSTDEFPTYTYSAPGIYPVRLIVYNGLCFDTVIHPITIHANPVGSFTISPAVPCPTPVTVTYTATAPPGNIITWLLMDTTTATGSVVTRNYASNSGSIDTVVMTMRDGFGCTTSIEQIDTLYNISVNLAANNTTGCIPLATTFSCTPSVTSFNPYTGQSVDLPVPYTITNYNWNFGDGSAPASGPHPTHTYTAVGVYNVSCTITTSSGCTRTGTIVIKTGIPPTASFTASPTHICAGQKVFFTGNVTGVYDAVSWGYGDGNTDTPAVLNANHKYDLPGTDTVRLYVYAHGCRNMVPPKLPIFIDSPGAQFGFTYTCIPNNGIVFTDISVGATSRKWFFGDGDTSLLSSVTHFFPSLSTYHTKLTTFNSTTGCRDTIIKEVDLNPPFLYFYGLDTSICKDQLATFISFTLGSASANEFRWYIDGSIFDSSTSSDISNYIAHNPGLHNIRLIVLDTRGCLDTFSRNNYLLVGNPIDSFVASPTNACGPVSVSFTDYSTGIPLAGAPLVSYSWSFGDGVNGIAAAPGVNHTYSAAGTYTVTETVTDNIGCTATWTSPIPITIYRPIANFHTDRSHACKNSNIHFTNTSTGASSILWDFGDGNTSTTPITDHAYSVSGTYTIKLIASDTHGCTDTLKMVNFITVDPSPVASFTMSDTFAVCPPLNVTFTNTSIGGATYNWTFGNGASSISPSPVNPYTSSGYYTVKLVVTNNIGCTDTAIHHANVFGYNGAFVYHPSVGCAPLPVHFSVVAGNVSSVVWDFSDGTTSDIMHVDTISHTYTQPGTYIPKLILKDSTGCTNSSYGADTIKVDTLTPNFSINPDPVCQKDPVVFSDLSHASYSNSSAWLWTFASGATSTLANPSFTYTSSGTFPVTLNVTSGSGCVRSVTKIMTVNPLPDAIIGVLTVCPGFTTNLNTTSTDGIWSSSTPTVATISSTGIVTGVAVGTTKITYTLLATGCFTTAVVTVYALPATITGSSEICAGFNTVLSSATTGGLWSSSNMAVGTINPTLGQLFGLSQGTTTITYALGTGCITTKEVTVDLVPATIGGIKVFCEGSTSYLTETTGGGSWSSSNTAVADIDATGIATGIAAGTAIISYGFATGCNTSTTVTVNPLPALITGDMEICVGNTSTLSTLASGGGWNSSIPGIASIDASGFVTGSIDGTSEIRYTLPTGCYRKIDFIVDPLPANITGTFDVCVASTVTLSNGSAGGTWASSDTAIATIGSLSGAVTGVSAGVAVITYTLPTGCYTTAVMTVETLPPPISEPRKVCAGFALNLTDAMPGGTWTADPAAAAIGTIHHLTGVVTGITGGTVTVTYTVFTGCATTAVITVNTLPPPIDGLPRVCVASSIMLSDTATGGGTWASNNTAIATVDAGSGVVTGIHAGIATISYFISTGCFNIVHTTVDPLPAAITGIATVCENATTVLSNTAPGGIWVSGNPTRATAAATGAVTGVSAGTVTISYQLPSGCVSTRIVTVYPTPPAIVGNANICTDAIIPYTDAMPGGTWSSSNISVVSIVSSSGLATPVALGTAVISYMVPTGGCFATKQVTVQPLPFVYDVTGGGSYCATGNGVHIKLDGSQLGISYLLYYGSSVTGYLPGTGDSLDFGLLAPAGIYTVLAINAVSGCQRDMNGSATVTITPLVAPSVAISALHGDTSCPGVPVDLAPVPFMGGSAPAYVWQVNGVSVSTAGTYHFIPANGDVVTLHMTSNENCILSDTASRSVIMTVLPYAMPAVGVTADPGDTVCQFTPTTFIASPVYGGDAPSVFWSVNGVYMASGNVYTYVPSRWDVVNCTMVSNYLCRLADTVSGGNITMIVDTILTPHIAIVPDPGLGVVAGRPITLSTLVTNAGPYPTYQWRINGHPVPGATQATYTAAFHDYDSIACAVTSSGVCDDITTFDWVFATVIPLGVQPVLNHNDIRLLPNPNNGIFILQGNWHINTDKEITAEITDMLGQVVTTRQITVINGMINEQISLDDRLANGMYILNLTSKDTHKTFHFIINR